MAEYDTGVSRCWGGEPPWGGSPWGGGYMMPPWGSQPGPTWHNMQMEQYLMIREIHRLVRRMYDMMEEMHMHQPSPR